MTQQPGFPHHGQTPHVPQPQPAYPQQGFQPRPVPPPQQGVPGQPALPYPGPGGQPTQPVRQFRLPPLLSLPEPKRLAPEGSEPDFPADVLLDSAKEVRAVAGWGIYVRMVLTQLVVWMLLSWIFLGGASPMLMLFWPLMMLDLGIMDSFLRSLYLSTPLLITLLLTAPLFGALWGGFTVPWALGRVAKLRPRRYGTEKEFRTAIGRCFAVVNAVPQIALLLFLLLLAALKVHIPWASLSFSVISAACTWIAVSIIGYLVTSGFAKAANVLRLPGVNEIEMRMAQARSPQEWARLAKILQVQDRRHLPRNTLALSPRMFRASFTELARAHWWVLLTASLLGAPVMWVAAIGRSVEQLDIDAGAEAFRASVPSLVEWSVFVLAVALWCAAINLVPALTLLLVKPKAGDVRDLRTFNTVPERFAVNAWEKRVVVVGCLLMVLVEVLIAALAALILAVGNALNAMCVVLLVIGFFVVIPLSAVATYHCLAKQLRTIVYGPVHWYARREAPLSAVAPQWGTKADLANDPAVRERELRERARILGLPETASPEEIAVASTRAGLLPDFGLGAADNGVNAGTAMYNFEPKDFDADTGEHAIPRRVDDLA